MAKMDYAEADKIRKKSLSDRIAEKMVEGESFGKSVSKSVSEGAKARVTNIKKKFDPMNMAKFMTGGSNLAPAIVGRLMGRDKKSMQYFTGKTDKKDTASKISPIALNERVLDRLEDIHGLLVDIRNKRDASKLSEEDVFEKKNLAEKRHKELIDAIKGTKEKKETATKVLDEDEGEDKSIFSTILEAFGLKELGKSAIRSIGKLASWAVGPVGGVLLGASTAAAFGYVMYKMLTDPSGYDKDPNSPLNKGLKQAESVGGLAGVKDEMEMRKGLPEYTRTLLELQDAEQTFWKDLDGNPQFGTDEQLKGYAARSPEAAEAVEVYKKKRDAVKGIKSKEDKKTSENIQTNVETDVGAAPDTTATAATGESTGAAPGTTATQVSTTGNTPTNINADTTAPSTTVSTSQAPNSVTGTTATSVAGNVTTPTDVSNASMAPMSVAQTNMTGKTATQVPAPVNRETGEIPTQTTKVSTMATPIESVPSSAAVNSAISENVNMNLPAAPDVTTSDIINNTTVNTQNQIQQDLSFPMPAVRNMEETFRRMILYSTRVV